MLILASFVKNAHKNGLLVVLAGSIQQRHMYLISEIQPDVVAVRGSVCINGDRNKGIDIDRVNELVYQLKMVVEN